MWKETKLPYTDAPDADTSVKCPDAKPNQDRNGDQLPPD